jgi:transcriptional regulator
VPTWNYTAVPAYGIPKILDREAMVALLKNLVAKHERSFEKPWAHGSGWISTNGPDNT